MEISFPESTDQHTAYSTPRISVVMPVYNAQDYIESSVESILNQRYSSFELLVLDDQSTDSTLRILERFRDSRIRIIPSEKHLGITGQLNKGLALAKGEFIARMDGDDLSLPTRFEEQVRFLETHHDVGICGSYYQTMNARGDKLDKVKTHTTNGILKYRSYFGNPFCHPTVMMRKSLVVSLGGYTDRYAAEDFDLWIRAYPVTHFHILPKILLQYRVHTRSVSHKEKLNQEKESISLKRDHLNNMMHGSLHENLLYALVGNKFDFPVQAVNEVTQAYELFLQSFVNSKEVSPVDSFHIKQEAAVFYLKLFLYTKKNSLLIPFFRNFISFPFFDKIGIAYREQAYLEFYRSQPSNAWLFLFLSFSKTPFSKSNIVLAIQLVRMIIKRPKFGYNS